MQFENARRILFRRAPGSDSASILVPNFKGRHYKLLSLLNETIEYTLGVFVYRLPSGFIYVHLKPKE